MPVFYVRWDKKEGVYKCNSIKVPLWTYFYRDTLVNPRVFISTNIGDRYLIIFTNLLLRVLYPIIRKKCEVPLYNLT